MGVMVRVAALALYAGLAALGTALLARPAVLWAEGLGLFRPVLPWPVPLGPAAALLALLIVGLTLAMAMHAIAGTRPRRRYHVALLLFLVQTDLGELQAFLTALQCVGLGTLGFFVGYPMGKRTGEREASARASSPRWTVRTS